MDTKSRSIRYSAGVKLAAVLLGIAGIVVFFYGTLRANDFEYAVQYGDYMKSRLFSDEDGTIQAYLEQLWNEGNLFPGQKGYLTDTELMEGQRKLEKTQQEIADQQAKAERDLQQRLDAAQKAEEKRSLAEALLAEARQMEADAGILPGTTDSRTEPVEEGTDANQPTPKDAELQTNAETKPASDSKVNAQDVEEEPDYYNLLRLREYLKNINGLQYSVVSNNTVYGPTVNFYKDLPYFRSFTLNSASDVLYFGYEKDAFLEREKEFDERRQNGINGIYMIGGGILLSFLAMLWLMYTAGRTRKEDGVVVNRFDSLAYLDISLLIATVLVVLACSAWIQMMEGNYINLSRHQGQGPMNITLLSILNITLLTAAYLLVLAYMVTLSKRFKRSEIIRHTVIYRFFVLLRQLLTRINAGIRAGLAAGPIAGKITVFLLAYGVASLLVCTFLAVVGRNSGPLGILAPLIAYVGITAYAVLFLAKRLVGFKTLAEGVRTIKNGNLTYKIPACGSYSIDSTIDDINNISAGLKAAVEHEISAERMKVELITNVSHDLRTPLTSIITYSDLLSAEGTTPEQVREYSAIIRAKSDKLRFLVDDLFEVSKAQSGSMSLELQPLNLNDLLAQAVAEFQEGLDNSRLELHVTVPPEKVSILADGARMWRVLSNIFGNVVKYSMHGTRVYVDVETSESSASLLFRNISSSPMKFQSDEIFERFKRGDESRSGEGSGLGLAIVKSFMEIQKGNCGITIDGDLFKLHLTMPLA